MMGAVNITKGVCDRRAQTGEPCFFVSYETTEGRHYEFFRQVFRMYEVYERLKKESK